MPLLDRSAVVCDIIQMVAVQTRELQGLAADAPVANVPWSQFPEDYSAMIVHMTCIQHYKRGLLAYTMVRFLRLRNKLLWPTRFSLFCGLSCTISVDLLIWKQGRVLWR